MPALMGAPNCPGSDMSGRTVDARKAYKLGLVDAEVPERHLKRAAVALILKKPEPHKPSFLTGLTNHKWIRPVLGRFIRSKLQQKAKQAHYPAPFAVLDNWIQHGIELPVAMTKEIDSIVNLVQTDTARNLIRVFYLKERMKGLAKGIDFKARHVHVIGAGTMGGDIAAWCALRGLTVTLQDREAKFIAPAIKRAANLLKAN